jgi:hypothetical protein
MSSFGSDMWRVKKTRTRFTCRFENLNHSVRNLLTILDLLHNPDLHVVHDQSQSCRITNVFQRYDQGVAG